MSLLQRLANWGEALPVPDILTRAAIALLVAHTRRSLEILPPDDAFFAQAMAQLPIAQHTAAAKAQHYEVPAAFYEKVLGPRRKYSCCYYEHDGATLEEAEEKALALTAAGAGIEDGQSILDLGCGWGALSLWLAQTYPTSRILAVSNSVSQRRHIEAQARQQGLGNLQVVTADMNDFAASRRFDRIVSVEMFEHMANWRELLGRMRGWLEPGGRLFVHVFAHRSGCYRFDVADKSDWVAQNFFSGGIMPSVGLIRQFSDLFTVEEEARWSGMHYRRTAQDWLARFDGNLPEIDPILEEVYGKDAALWRRRWRLFFLATSGLFGHADGEVWGVSHYRLRPR